MKNSRIVLPLVSFAVIFLCIICVLNIVRRLMDEEEEANRGCPTVPGGVSEASLIGTWLAQEYATALTGTVNDKLIFREDGTYQQIIHIRRRSGNIRTAYADYESDRQAWKIEFGPKGIPYLYLQDFRECASSEYIDCDWVENSGVTIDDCCGEIPRPPHPGETVLTVLGPPYYLTPQGTRKDIRLMLFRGCEVSGWEYQYQGP